MNCSIKAIGVHTEPQPDGGLTWSHQKHGKLEIGEKFLRFGELEIAINTIENAVFNAERQILKDTRTLLFECNDFSYQFFLLEPLPESYRFPFEATYTSNQSFTGRLTKLAGLLLVAGLAIQLVAAVLEAFL